MLIGCGGMQGRLDHGEMDGADERWQWPLASSSWERAKERWHVMRVQKQSVINCARGEREVADEARTFTITIF
jgi:hypothetical protein